MSNSGEIKTLEPGVWGYKSLSKYKKYICPQCGKEYLRYKDDIEYKYNNLKFCTWSCKCRYKENERNRK